MHKLFFGNATKYYDEKEFRLGYAEIDAYRKNKIDKLKVQEDKARSLTAGLLFKEACSAFGVTELMGFVKDTDDGKPYFDCGDEMFPDNKRIYFSISHSKDYVLVGMADEEIGVDIQYMKEIKADVASRCFTEDEQDYYYKASEDEYISVFYKIWCLKESYSKYKGTGLKEGFNTFSVMDYMQDCGVWHDEYIYAVTTQDYKEEYIAKKEEKIDMFKEKVTVASSSKKTKANKDGNKEDTKEKIKENTKENTKEQKNDNGFQTTKEEKINVDATQKEIKEIQEEKQKEIKKDNTNTKLDSNKKTDIDGNITKSNIVKKSEEITKVPDLDQHILDKYNHFSSNEELLEKIGKAEKKSLNRKKMGFMKRLNVRR